MTREEVEKNLVGEDVWKMVLETDCLDRAIREQDKASMKMQEYEIYSFN